MAQSTYASFRLKQKTFDTFDGWATLSRSSLPVRVFIVYAYISLLIPGACEG